MSVEKIAFKQGSWLAAFKYFTQLFSWATTIIVARLLLPKDYGLMAMATILTGYAALFAELGFGAAIIQRSRTTQQELSSVFWFTVGVSLLFAVSCFPLSYLTAYIFHEPRVIPLTQTVSLIFLINGLYVVPYNLIKKNLKFKKLGFTEMAGSLVACVFMVILASQGAGVWTLIVGQVIQAFTNLILAFYFSKWIPKMHFHFNQIKAFFTFGIQVSINNTFNYVFKRSDRLFAGRAWSANILGYYTFALQLSMIPVEKIVSIINQVSFVVFSELQYDKDAFNNFYLKVTKITALCVFPLFCGGYLLGEDLIKVLLDDKWLPIIFLFKILCLSQIFTALMSINHKVHDAQGRPHWGAYFSIVLSVLMGFAFYIAVNHGVNTILIPWITLYPIICLSFMFITVRKIGISILNYAKNIYVPFLATMIMSLVVFSSDILFPAISMSTHKIAIILIFKIFLGGLAYIGAIFALDNTILKKMYDMIKMKKIQHESA